jgi:hypothetical protein
VPRAELACCRVGDDGDLMAAQPGGAALRLLSGPAAVAGRRLVYLHGMGNRPHALWWRCSRPGIAPRGVARAWVGGGDYSCERVACRARQRLVGGGSSSGELVGGADN